MNDPYHTVWGDSRIDAYFKETRKMTQLYIEYAENPNTPTVVKIDGVVSEDVKRLDVSREYDTVSAEIWYTNGHILTIPYVELTIQRINVRPDWDEYFLAICNAVAERADCRRAQHGCIIVKDKRIVSTGYNGSPSGGPSCLAGECPRGLLSNEQCRSLSSYENCVAIHAEANAIAYANRSDTVGATLYVTGVQCDMCRKLTKAAGIKRVVWPGGEEEF